MKIVVAYDGSDYAKRAVLFMLKLIKKEDEINLVTVIKKETSGEQVTIRDREDAIEKQKEIIKELTGYKVNSIILEGSDVADTIIDYCSKINCDLIVTGSRGLTGLKKTVLGSVSSSLVSKAKVPVLVVK